MLNWLVCAIRNEIVRPFPPRPLKIEDWFIFIILPLIAITIIGYYDFWPEATIYDIILVMEMPIIMLFMKVVFLEEVAFITALLVAGALSIFLFILDITKDMPLIAFGKVLSILYIIASMLILALRCIIVIKRELDKRAYFFLALCFSAIIAAFVLQYPAKWATWATLSVPLVIPGLGWKIPLTESLGFPLAMLGLYNEPVSTALGSVQEARIAVWALYAVAFALFIYARHLFEKSATVLYPGSILLVFGLLVASLSMDILLHAKDAPDPGVFAILINRVFALGALLVILFWRDSVKGISEHAPGAEGLYRQAMDASERRALFIGVFVLGLVWVYTTMTHVFTRGFPDWITNAMFVAASIPFLHAVNFMREHRNNAYYQQYLRALEISRRSHNPPPTEPSPDDIDRGLNGRGGNDRRRFGDDGN